MGLKTKSSYNWIYTWPAEELSDDLRAVLNSHVMIEWGATRNSARNSVYIDLWRGYSRDNNIEGKSNDEARNFESPQ